MEIKPYENVDEIRILMNKYTKEHMPYLFILNFELTEGYFIKEPFLQSEILFQIQNSGNKKNTSEDILNVSQPKMRSFPLTKESYESQFNIIQTGLHDGNSFLANLTIKTEIETNLPLEAIFYMSNAPYTLYVPERFVCFSPERFVKIQDGIISTNPMKGTIDASLPDAENVILNSFKEKAEHHTIVDLLRNDISQIANNVCVSNFRYVDKVKTQCKDILQVSSEIEGHLMPEYKNMFGDIIFKMLPAGSVSGAPKSSTIKLIREAEKVERGYYTGIFGYFDGSTLDSAVLIRFIEESNNKKYFRSGGGITAYSNSNDEYIEALNKIYLPLE